jgi:hypothetical protein
MRRTHATAIEKIAHLKVIGVSKFGTELSNPIPRGRCPARLLSKKEAAARNLIREQFVSLAKVLSHQSRVFSEHLTAHIRRQKRTLAERLPLVYHHNGSYYVTNGNHRIAAMLLKNRTKMKMRVIDLSSL